MALKGWGEWGGFSRALKAQKEGKAEIMRLRVPRRLPQPPHSESLFLLYLCIWSFSAIFKNSCELRALRQAQAGSRGHPGTVNIPSDHKSQTLPALKCHKIQGVRAEDQVPDKHKTKQAERKRWVPGWG